MLEIYVKQASERQAKICNSSDITNTGTNLSSITSFSSLCAQLSSWYTCGTIIEMNNHDHHRDHDE